MKCQHGVGGRKKQDNRMHIVIKAEEELLGEKRETCEKVGARKGGRRRSNEKPRGNDIMRAITFYITLVKFAKLNHIFLT